MNKNLNQGALLSSNRLKLIVKWIGDTYKMQNVNINSFRLEEAILNMNRKWSHAFRFEISNKKLEIKRKELKNDKREYIENNDESMIKDLVQQMSKIPEEKWEILEINSRDSIISFNILIQMIQVWDLNINSPTLLYFKSEWILQFNGWDSSKILSFYIQDNYFSRIIDSINFYTALGTEPTEINFEIKRSPNPKEKDIFEKIENCLIQFFASIFNIKSRTLKTIRLIYIFKRFPEQPFPKIRKNEFKQSKQLKILIDDKSRPFLENLIPQLLHLSAQFVNLEEFLIEDTHKVAKDGKRGCICNPFSNLSPLTKLKNLSIDYALELTDSTVVQLPNYFNKVFPNLQCLHLKIIKYDKLNNKEAEEATSHVSNLLAPLQNLSLKFELWDEFAGKRVTEVVSSITSTLTDLQHFSLNIIDNNNELTDKDVTELADYISNKLIKLQYLSLSFRLYRHLPRDPDQLICKGLVGLGSYISNGLTNLQHLSLDFNDFKNLDDEEVTKIACDISFLHFPHCHGISNQMAEEVVDILKKGLTNLKKFSIFKYPFSFVS